MFTADYFAGSYFAPSYFAGTGSVVVVYSDARTIYADIEAKLTATGSFAEVTRRSLPEKGRFRTPAAIIRPVSETEVETGMSPECYDVTCTYNLTIVVKAEDEVERYNLLRQLAAVAQNTLTYVSLGNQTKPAFTSVGRLRHESRPTHPYERVYLTGTFQYETGTGNRATTELA